MKIRDFCSIGIIVLSIAMPVSHGSAQDGTQGGQSIKYKVIKGYAEVKAMKYPVCIGLREVVTTQLGGITYTVTQKKHKQALLMAEKIKRFYVGKKIGALSLPSFKKIGKPDVIAWNSIKCGTGGEGIHAVVKVDDKTVSVFLFPSCDEGVLAMIL